jgi:excisionase family DNA binding protein
MTAVTDSDYAAELDTRGGPLLLTVPQAAALLSIGRTTAYELISAGELEVVHIRRAARVPVAAVEDYVRKLREAP